MYTKNLDGWKNFEETDSCYLDGRYFNKVFSEYPGLLKNPIEISISERRIDNIGKDFKFSANMKDNYVDTSFPGLLRTVITTDQSGSRHSNLVILDYQNRIAYRFEPLGKQALYFEKINQIIENFLSEFLDFQLEVIDIELDEILDDQNQDCLEKDERTGFCTAYIILYAYSFINQEEFEPSDIRRFAKMIEVKYGPLPKKGAEKDYGKSDLSEVEKFVEGPGRYKYTAIMKNGKRVNFGHRDYEHYRDSVPKSMGGGIWSHKDHGDTKRRDNYRSRHGGVLTKDGKKAYQVKYSPSWFSYYYLW